MVIAYEKFLRHIQFIQLSARVELLLVDTLGLLLIEWGYWNRIIRDAFPLCKHLSHWLQCRDPNIFQSRALLFGCQL